MRNMTIDSIDRRYGIQWRFDTARYTIAFWAEDEHLAPEDTFCDARDITFASDGDPAHWFCAFVGVFERTEDDDGECLGYDVLGGCSYNSFREFYSSHRWQYQRAGARKGKWLTDPRDPAFKRALKRQQGHNGTYFTDMVRQAIREAKHTIALRQAGAEG